MAPWAISQMYIMPSASKLTEVGVLSMSVTICHQELLSRSRQRLALGAYSHVLAPLRGHSWIK